MLVISNPFQILIKLNDNIYVIDLLINFKISSTFNIDCLVNYKGLINIIPLADEPFPEPVFESLFILPLPEILSHTACQINKLLNDKIITTQVGEIRKYMIWTVKVPTDDI